MLKPATVRMPEEFLKEIASFVKDLRLDKSAYMREIMQKGFEEDRRERFLAKYQAGDLSVGEVCRLLDFKHMGLPSDAEKEKHGLERQSRRLAQFH